jgi:hypothetical protein
VDGYTPPQDARNSPVLSWTAARSRERSSTTRAPRCRGNTMSIDLLLVPISVDLSGRTDWHSILRGGSVCARRRLAFGDVAAAFRAEFTGATHESSADTRLTGPGFDASLSQTVLYVYICAGSLASLDVDRVYTTRRTARTSTTTALYTRSSTIGTARFPARHHAKAHEPCPNRNSTRSSPNATPPSCPQRQQPRRGLNLHTSSSGRCTKVPVGPNLLHGGRSESVRRPRPILLARTHTVSLGTCGRNAAKHPCITGVRACRNRPDARGRNR